MNATPSPLSLKTAVQDEVPSFIDDTRPAWRITFPHGDVSVRPLPPDIALRRLGEATSVRASVAGRTVELLLPKETLRLVIERLEPLVLWERLSPPARADVLECLLADILKRLEDEIGGMLSIDDIRPLAETTLDINYAFDVRWDGLAFVLCGAFEPNMLSGLARWAKRLPPRSLRHLTTVVCLRRGYAMLTAAEIASLSSGDAIVIDPAMASTAVAVTGECYLAACTRTLEGFVLTESLLKRPTSPMRHFMVNEQIDAEFHGDPQPLSIADIPIKLVFEAGRVELPLGRLEALGEGHVFPLDRPLDETVDIVAQGRIIGRGEIVTLDGFAAVRITALTD